MDQIREATAFLNARIPFTPETGIILGTGLGAGFVQQITDPVMINYKDIPHFPIATVEFHKGRIVAGYISGKPVIALQGRFHYYEGYSMQQISFPVRVLKVLGIKRLLISNAAGNMNTAWKKGELMLLDDHINLQPDNPLRGHNDEELGPRFPDMSQPYHAGLNQQLEQIASAENIPLRKGVYAAVPGPNLETRAEYRYLRRIGADAVGMSTVPEVIVAVHMNLPVCAVSVLTDDCDPDHLEPAKIEDILATAGKAEPLLTRLFTELIGRL